MHWFRIALLAAAGYVGAVTAIRVGVVRPLRQLMRRLEGLLDLPDAVQDLTTTILRYIQENERRLTRVETNVSTIARVLRVDLNLEDDDEPRPPT
jgi:hypothetical protein